MSDFQQYAVQRLIDKATEAGVKTPPSVTALVHGDHSYAARTWAEQHPDADSWCCHGAAIRGPAACTCWTAIYDVDQAQPRPLTEPGDLQPRPQMCGDCAFRKDSPERADEWSEEALLALADAGQPFWCHDGMRRPTHWAHPDGRTISGDPADWHPAKLGAIPYRADGRPALLCAGWTARAARVEVDR